jgi:hypothetical protein
VVRSARRRGPRTGPGLSARGRARAQAFPEEPAAVQLQLVTAAVKLFLKKPQPRAQQMIQLVLTYATQARAAWRPAMPRLGRRAGPAERAAPPCAVAIAAFSFAPRLLAVQRVAPAGCSTPSALASSSNPVRLWPGRARDALRGAARQETDNPDLRDRAFIYWRLLSTDPEAARAVVLAEKPVIADTAAALEPSLLATLLANLATLASVYHKPPEARARPGAPGGMKSASMRRSPLREPRGARGLCWAARGRRRRGGAARLCLPGRRSAQAAPTAPVRSQRRCRRRTARPQAAACLAGAPSRCPSHDTGACGKTRGRHGPVRHAAGGAARRRL